MLKQRESTDKVRASTVFLIRYGFVIVLLILLSNPTLSKNSNRERSNAPGSMAGAIFKHRGTERLSRGASLKDKMQTALAGHVVGKPRGALVKIHPLSSTWRCCPPAWFDTKPSEVVADVVFVRPYKTSCTTIQTLLWRWAVQRGIPVIANPQEMQRNESALSLKASSAKTIKGSPLPAGRSRLFDARLSFPEYEEILRAQSPSLAATLGMEPTVFITMLREPLERAVALFYWAHRKPESVKTAGQVSPRLWRREQKGAFCREHLAHARAFAAQNESLAALYRITPMWTSFGADAEDAAAALRRGHFLVGFSDRFDEFVVLLRFRLGWRSLRDALYLSTNHYRAPGPQEWPPAPLAVLNASWPVATDHRFVKLARAHAEEQRRSFSAPRLAREVGALEAVLADVRGHCDPRNSERRPAAQYFPACKHHCEGHARLEACFLARFNSTHSAEAQRLQAAQLRSLSGPAAVAHTPLEA